MTSTMMENKIAAFADFDLSIVCKCYSLIDIKILKPSDILQCSKSHTIAQTVSELKTVTHTAIRFSLVKVYNVSKCYAKEM